MLRVLRLFPPTHVVRSQWRSFSARAPAALPVAFLTRPFLHFDRSSGSSCFIGSPMSRKILFFLAHGILSLTCSDLFLHQCFGINLLEVQLNGVNCVGLISHKVLVILFWLFFCCEDVALMMSHTIRSWVAGRGCCKWR